MSLSFEAHWKKIEHVLLLRDIQSTLQTLVDFISRELKVDIVSILLFHDETQELRVHAIKGLEQRLLYGKSMTLGDGISGWVAQTKHPLFIDDVTQDKRFKASPFAYQYSSPSLISFPLLYRESLLGVVNINNKMDGQPFNSQDLARCMEWQPLLGEILHNASVYQAALDQNITLNNQCESLQKKQEELIEKDKKRSKFLAAIAHEINMPLTSLKGYAEMVGRLGILPKKVKDMLELLSNEIKRMINISSNVLDLTKFYANKNVLNKRWIIIREIVEKVVSIMEAQAASKGLQLVVDNLDPTLRLFADSEKLQQVLQNLLSNAIKYSQQGTIVVASWRERDSMTCISVKDQGKGISAAHLNQIFDEFYRIPEDDDEQATPGSGLGLAMVKSIVDAHGGSIHVDSIPDIGSTFTLVFPDPK